MSAFSGSRPHPLRVSAIKMMAPTDFNLFIVLSFKVRENFKGGIWSDAGDYPPSA